MCCLRVCKGNFPLRIRRKTPRPPCFRRPFGAGSCSGICRAICAKRDGVFWLQAGQRCLSTYRRGGWEFFGCGRGERVSLPTTRGMEFFGCGRGKGVSLPTAVGAGSFLGASRARGSLYRPPRGMEFFGCRRGEGVSLPTAAGAGSRKTPTPQAGWAVVGDCGRIIGAKRILYERNVGGLNNLVLAQEEQ